MVSFHSNGTVTKVYNTVEFYSPIKKKMILNHLLENGCHWRSLYKQYCINIAYIFPPVLKNQIARVGTTKKKYWKVRSINHKRKKDIKSHILSIFLLKWYFLTINVLTVSERTELISEVLPPAGEAEPVLGFFSNI